MRSHVEASNTQAVLLDRLNNGGWRMTAKNRHVAADFSGANNEYRRAIPVQQLRSMERKGLIKFNPFLKQWVPGRAKGVALAA